MYQRQTALRQKRGLTLLELLVVITVIGILMALLLSGVQSIRESARRISCSNNLRQLGLALQTYHNAHQAFPLNSSFGEPLGPAYRTRSWLQGVLPFVERPVLHREIGSTLILEQNRAFAETPVAVFRCASDTSAERMTNRADVPADWDLALTSYKSCGGSNWKWGTFVHAESSGRFASEANGMAYGNGIICAGRGPVLTTRMAHVRDGLSNSFAIGETLGELTRWSWWFHSNSAAGTCAAPLNFGKLLADHDDWQNNNGFMSRHPGGGQFAMADGSTRYVAEGVDLASYRSFATIDGGEVAAD